MTGWPVASKMWLGDRSLLVNSALSYFQICKNYTIHYCSWKIYLEVINSFYIFKIFQLFSPFFFLTILASFPKASCHRITELT